MNVFQVQNKRNLKHTVLMSILLTLTVSISSIAFTTWLGIMLQHSRLKEYYTTIAVANNTPRIDTTGEKTSISTPNNIKKKRNTLPSFYGKDSFYVEDTDGNIHYFPGPEDVAEAAATSPNFVRMDRRILLSAYVEGMTALTSGTTDILDYRWEADAYCYSGCVAAVECVMAEVNEEKEIQEKTYQFRILDWISRSQVYELPEDDFIYMETTLANPDGSFLFEEGKTYLVWGFYRDYNIYTSPQGERKRLTNSSQSRHIYIERYYWSGSVLGNGILSDPEFKMENYSEKTGVNTYETRYYHMAEGAWPVGAEYTGSWESFLETEDGKIWAEEIIPTMETGHHSAPVLLSDDVESMYNFIVGDAMVTDGRMFTREEYVEGKLVCMVSNTYAELNNLQIGDSINLDFYNSGYNSYGISNTSTLMRKPMLERHRLGIKQDYVIVGIYTCPGYGGSMYDFGEDTIFVPKNSVPGWETYYTGLRYPVLDSIVIENGSIEEFEAFLTEHHMDGYFYYVDQGYAEAEEAFLMVKHNAIWILMIGLLIFLPGSLAFISLKMKRYRPVIHSLRRLGVNRKTTWRQCVTDMLTSIFFPVILGTAAGTAFFEFIVAEILQIDLKLQAFVLLLCGGFCFVFILCTSGIFVNWATSRNLMGGRKVKV